MPRKTRILTSLWPSLTRPLTTIGDGEKGFIHEVAYRTYLGEHPCPENNHYYLCGPPLMVRAALAMLDNLGVESSAIFFDDFGG